MVPSYRDGPQTKVAAIKLEQSKHLLGSSNAVGDSFVGFEPHFRTFLYIPPQLHGAAVGLLALLRNEGGSVGTSVAQTLVERREQFHSLRLGEDLDRLNPAVNSYLHQAQSVSLQQTGDPAAAKQMALQTLANLREQQSSALSYFDTFFIFAVGAE